MCYSAQLVLEFGNDPPKEDPWMMDRLRKWNQAKPLHYVPAHSRPLWPVVTSEAPDEVQELRWGLIPAGVVDPKAFLKRSPTYNAASETVYDDPSFKAAMAAGRRCLIPVTGFYEWMHVGKVTYPHFISLKSRKLFSLAGAYEPASSETNGTYTILACAANSLMQRIHNTEKRMPVILPVELEATWLEPALGREEVLALCKPYPEHDMDWWTVSRMLSSHDLDRNVPEACDPVQYPELLRARPLF